MRTKRDLVQELSSTFSGIAEHTARKYPQQAWLYAARAKYWKELLTAREQGKGIAWTSFCSLSEILWAMDLVPVPMEATFGVLSALPKGIMEYLDIADRFVPDHICAANRGMIGAAVAGEIIHPDVIVHASQPCDSGLTSFTNVAQYLGVPYYCIDTPYWNDEATFSYLAEEIENVVAFLEEHTGRKLDFDRLREVVGYSNQAHAYYLKINALRKLEPCPLPGVLHGHNASSFLAMAGMPELVDYCKAQYELGAERAARGEGTIPDEKLRLAWIYVAVMHDPRLFDWLEREHKAVAVMDMLAHYTSAPIVDLSSPKKIYRGLAEKMANMPMAKESRGPMEYYANSVIDMCREYRCDAAIFSGHMACKQGWAVIKLIKDRVQEELGIPMLVFDVDCFDPRITSSETIRGRLSDFLKVMT